MVLMSARAASVRSAEVAIVRAAAVVQGLALVTVPTLSTVLTDPARFALSQTAYGALFVPQSVLAIVFSLAGGRLTRRFGLKRVLLVGLAADAVSMGLLAASARLGTSHAFAYAALLCATACLGFGFAIVTPALNVLAGGFEPRNVDRAVLIVNALLGAAAALAPVLLVVFVGLGFWWGLPLLAGSAMAVLFALAQRLPFDVAQRAAAGSRLRLRVLRTDDRVVGSALRYRSTRRGRSLRIARVDAVLGLHRGRTGWLCAFQQAARGHDGLSRAAVRAGGSFRAASSDAGARKSARRGRCVRACRARRVGVVAARDQLL